MKKYFVTFFVCLLSLPVWAQPPGVQPEEMVTLIFSSNVYGEIEPCG